MPAMNRVWIMGNLTRDPAVRDLPSGTKVAEFAVATSETRRSRNGEKTETKCFVDVVAWERQAEACGKYLRKGAPVGIDGRLQFEQWKTDNGENRTKLKVRADRVEFLGRNGDGEER